jgi:hypothetical protein
MRGEGFMRGVGILATAAVFGLVGFSFFSCSEDDYYFSCTGETGLAENQSTLFFASRVITRDGSREDGSIHILGNKVTIEGIPFVAGEYKVCGDEDQILWFSPSGAKEWCANNDMFNDLGMFNKVTGRLIYHGGDFLGNLQCRRATKLYR